MMLTLNQILTKVEAFFNGHEQIKQVVIGNEYEFAAERELTYPVVQIDYRGSDINDKMMNYKFRILIGDVVDENVSGMKYEVYSDTLQIAEDFFAWLWEQEGVVTTKRTDISWFDREGGDRVAGSRFDIALGIVRSQNACQIPLK